MSIKKPNLETLKQKTAGIKDAVISEWLVPGFIAGIIDNWLEGKTAKQFYGFVIAHKGQHWLLELAPELDVNKAKGVVKNPSWLTIDWFVKVTKDEHPDISGLILTSPEVKEEIERQLELIRLELSSD